ncbi:MAG: hypothetical protein KME29_04785 [Calothrix sp. FI2-JRJ7]|jgi:hypothetical protein|nr:hypothetical protein [Calothrix sp. FI2-JRJ7]
MFVIPNGRMAVNISARNYQLVVNGLDCTKALKSVDGGFSHYDSTGLILINASFVLGRALDFTENLDDRSNPRWARGNLINLYIANFSSELVAAPLGETRKTGGQEDKAENSSLSANLPASLVPLQSAPVLGYLYILKAEFDGISQLKIEAGCILNLLNFRTPAGDGACFDLGESVGLNEIAVKLLNKAGASGKWAGSLNGAPLRVPLPKLSNESYIQLFGKLCWVNCFVAYQDNLGMIRTRKVSKAPAAIKSLQVGIDDARYERLAGAESPVELIKVSGVLSTKKEVEPTVTIEEEYGPVSAVNPESNSLSVILLRRTKTIEKIERFSRQIKIETFIEEPLGIIDPRGKKGDTQLWDSSYKLEIKDYELPGTTDTGTVTQGATLDNCQEPDEGKLSRHGIEIYRPFVVVLRDYLEEKGIEPSDIGGGLVFWLDEANIIDYSYEQKEDKDTKKITIIPRIVNETTRPVGQILPNESYANFPLTHYPAKRQRQQWREKRKEEWEFKETNFECLAIVSPSLVEPTDSNVVISLASKLVLVERSARTIVSNSGQATPPAPERFPPTHEVIEKQIKVEVRLPALFGNPQFRPREKEIVIDGGLLTSEQQARELGLIEGAILWGRHKGQSCSIAVGDEWFNAAPLVGCWWKDLSGASYLFMVDGLSIAFVNNRLALAFDGIWCGSVPAGIAPEQQYDYLVPPYSQVFDVELDSLSILESEAFPYSIELSFVEAGFFSQSGFGILTEADIFDIELGSVSSFLMLTDADICDVQLGSTSGFALTTPINISLNSASGIFVLAAEGIQLGSTSGVDVNVDDFDIVVELGSVSGFEIEQAPEFYINLQSASSVDIGINNFDVVVELESSSGFNADIPGFFNVQLGSFQELKIDVDSFDASVDLGAVSGFDVEQAPRIDIELGSMSGIDSETYNSELVTHAGDALLVSSNGARWTAFMPDMKHLALEWESIFYQQNIIANGGSIARGDLIGINAFIQEMKAANLWNRCLEIYPFAGNNLASARVKLKTSTSQNLLTNFNFVESDYTRFSGLRGNGLNKRLGTGFLPVSNGLTDNNFHISAWAPQIERGSTVDGYYTGLTSTGTQRIFLRNSSSLSFAVGDSALVSIAKFYSQPGFLCGSALSGIAYARFIGIERTQNFTPAGLTLNREMPVFAGGFLDGHTRYLPGLISFLSIGKGLNASEIRLLENIVLKLQMYLGRIT